jgi:hypothetical protein
MAKGLPRYRLAKGVLLGFAKQSKLIASKWEGGDAQCR